MGANWISEELNNNHKRYYGALRDYYNNFFIPFLKNLLSALKFFQVFLLNNDSKASETWKSFFANEFCGFMKRNTPWALPVLIGVKRSWCIESYLEKLLMKSRKRQNVIEQENHIKDEKLISIRTWTLTRKIRRETNVNRILRKVPLKHAEPSIERNQDTKSIPNEWFAISL